MAVCCMRCHHHLLRLSFFIAHSPRIMAGRAQKPAPTSKQTSYNPLWRLLTVNIIYSRLECSVIELATFIGTTFGPGWSGPNKRSVPLTDFSPHGTSQKFVNSNQQKWSHKTRVLLPRCCNKRVVSLFDLTSWNFAEFHKTGPDRIDPIKRMVPLTKYPNKRCCRTTGQQWVEKDTWLLTSRSSLADTHPAFFRISSRVQLLLARCPFMEWPIRLEHAQ